ncbi:MAG: SDR family oxidoreductase [Flavobacteriales bacterium]
MEYEKIGILGCGWLGMELAKTCIQSGYSVYGSTSTPEKLSIIKSHGIMPFLVDINNSNEISLDFFDVDVLIVCITSKNIDDYKNLIQRIEETNLYRVIFISSTSVYPNLNKNMTEDDDVLEGNPLVEIEALFLNHSNINATILRFAGLFGGERHPGKWFANKQIPNPNGFVNMVHRKDCIGVISQVIEKNAWNEVFNVCSNHHPTRKAFYTQARKALDLNEPTFGDAIQQSNKNIDSSKVQNILGYKFQVDDLLKFEWE